jgi:hypothetical protein
MKFIPDNLKEIITCEYDQFDLKLLFPDDDLASAFE